MFYFISLIVSFLFSGGIYTSFKLLGWLFLFECIMYSLCTIHFYCLKWHFSNMKLYFKKFIIHFISYEINKIIKISKTKHIFIILLNFQKYLYLFTSVLLFLDISYLIFCICIWAKFIFISILNLCILILNYNF